MQAMVVRGWTFVALALPAILATAWPAGAADKTWNGSGNDNNWGTGGNWVGGSAPATGDNLFFTNSAAARKLTGIIDANRTVANITFRSGANDNWTINGKNSAYLTVNGDITCGDGTSYGTYTFSAGGLSRYLILSAGTHTFTVTNAGANLTTLTFANGADLNGGRDINFNGNGKLVLSAYNGSGTPSIGTLSLNTTPANGGGLYLDSRSGSSSYYYWITNIVANANDTHIYPNNPAQATYLNYYSGSSRSLFVTVPTVNTCTVHTANSGVGFYFGHRGAATYAACYKEGAGTLKFAGAGDALFGRLYVDSGTVDFGGMTGNPDIYWDTYITNATVTLAGMAGNAWFSSCGYGGYGVYINNGGTLTLTGMVGNAKFSQPIYINGGTFDLRGVTGSQLLDLNYGVGMPQIQGGAIKGANAFDECIAINYPWWGLALNINSGGLLTEAVGEENEILSSTIINVNAGGTNYVGGTGGTNTLYVLGMGVNDSGTLKMNVGLDDARSNGCNDRIIYTAYAGYGYGLNGTLLLNFGTSNFTAGAVATLWLNSYGETLTVDMGGPPSDYYNFDAVTAMGAFTGDFEPKANGVWTLQTAKLLLTLDINEGTLTAVSQSGGVPKIQTLAATNVVGGEAWMNANLITNGASSAQVYVNYGTTDQGSTGVWDHTVAVGAAGAWADGSYPTYHATGLTAPVYFYQFSASNDAGMAWADSSASFTQTPAIVTLDPTNFVVGAIWMNGQLVANGAWQATVYVHYGSTDQGTNGTWDHTVAVGAAGAWADGSYPTYHATGLTEGDYFYRFSASNEAGEVWGDSKYFIHGTVTLSSTNQDFSPYPVWTLVNGTNWAYLGMWDNTPEGDRAALTFTRPIACTGGVLTVTLRDNDPERTNYAGYCTSGHLEAWMTNLTSYTIPAGSTSLTIAVWRSWYGVNVAPSNHAFLMTLEDGLYINGGAAGVWITNKVMHTDSIWYSSSNCAFQPQEDGSGMTKPGWTDANGHYYRANGNDAAGCDPNWGGTAIITNGSAWADGGCDRLDDLYDKPYAWNYMRPRPGYDVAGLSPAVTFVRPTGILKWGYAAGSGYAMKPLGDPSPRYPHDLRIVLDGGTVSNNAALLGTMGGPFYYHDWRVKANSLLSFAGDSTKGFRWCGAVRNYDDGSTGILTKTNTGTLFLFYTNSPFTGGWDICQGWVKACADGALGSNGTVTLHPAGVLALASSLTLYNMIGGVGTCGTASATLTLKPGSGDAGVAPGNYSAYGTGTVTVAGNLAFANQGGSRCKVQIAMTNSAGVWTSSLVRVTGTLSGLDSADLVVNDQLVKSSAWPKGFLTNTIMTTTSDMTSAPQFNSTTVSGKGKCWALYGPGYVKVVYAPPPPGTAIMVL